MEKRSCDLMILTSCTVPQKGSGRLARAQCTLGASSYVYAEGCPAQDPVSRISAHVRMLEFWGGPRRSSCPITSAAASPRPAATNHSSNRTYLELDSQNASRPRTRGRRTVIVPQLGLTQRGDAGERGRELKILCSLFPGSGRSSDRACARSGRGRARGVAPGRGTRRGSWRNHYPWARPLKTETRVRIPLGPPQTKEPDPCPPAGRPCGLDQGFTRPIAFM